MDATLQDLIDRGVKRIYVELKSIYVEAGEKYVGVFDLNEENFEHFWESRKTYFCLALDENGDDVAYNDKPLDYLDS